MKLKNDNTRNELLQIAKSEFLEKGFRDASLRTIAKKANRTTGTIYTYFKNKNEIFESLVKPVIIKIEKKLIEENITFTEAINKNMDLKDWFTTYDKFIIEISESNRDELNLLFLKSEGSKFTNYKSELIELAKKRSVDDLKDIKRSKDFKGQMISDFFIANMIEFMFHSAIMLITQEMNKQEKEQFENEITTFLYNGWKGLYEF